MKSDPVRSRVHNVIAAEGACSDPFGVAQGRLFGKLGAGSSGWPARQRLVENEQALALLEGSPGHGCFIEGYKLFT